MVDVRPAVPGDVPRLRELRAELVELAVAHRGGAAWVSAEGEDAPQWAAAGGSGGVDGVMVGTVRDEVVGYAQIAVRGRLGIIEALFVTPPARTVGVGDALLRHARDELSARGCDRVDSYALPGDRDTKNFFESHAMVARLLVVSSELPPS